MQRLKCFLPRFTTIQKFFTVRVGLLLFAVFLAGCGGSGSNTSARGGGVEGLQINGIAQTSDVSLSANGSSVPVSNATITVISSATGKQAGQEQTGADGHYFIQLAVGGVYTVVPSPVTVGSVTLVAPTQQVTVVTLAASITSGNTGAQIVPITYTRQ